MSYFTWKIGGEAGFGIMTTGLVFSKMASRLGYHIFDYVQYPSLIRGGHNAYEVIVSETEVNSLKQEIDCLVCLNKDSFDHHKKRLVKQGLVIYDQDEFKIDEDFTKINVPFLKILSSLKGKTVMKNTIALGASMAILGGEISELFSIIEEQFLKKGEQVVEFNKQFAQEGFNYVKNNYSNKIAKILVKKNNQAKLVLSGNDAFSLGSVISDCRVYVAYPMTPSSSVLTSLAGWQEKTGMIVRHAEDEISVINTAIGSSFAGVRSAVGTSGGGFSLMVESLSLAGITETPLVVFLAQRPGPATGMPTWTEQGDLLFSIHAGHGEFTKIVLAPGDAEEMLSLTTEAYNFADIYQTPVIILSDMLLSESHKTITKKYLDDLIAGNKIDRGKIIDSSNLTGEQNFLRYKITEDGISPRIIPGAAGYYYQANSYEHLEDGHTTEDGPARTSQVDKRNRKQLTYLKNHFQLPKIYGNIDKASLVFVSWGSAKGPILEAIKLLNQQNTESALIHFSYLYPLDKEKIIKLFNNNKKYILVENNSWSQLGKLLMGETGIEIKEKILKYDGRPFWPEEIVNKVLNLR